MNNHAIVGLSLICCLGTWSTGFAGEKAGDQLPAVQRAPAGTATQGSVSRVGSHKEQPTPSAKEAPPEEPRQQHAAFRTTDRSGIDWDENLITAYHRALAAGKPMVVLFSVPWCEHCRDLDAHVLTTSAMQPFAAQAIFVRVNPEKDKNAENLANSLKITGYPTVAVLQASRASIDEKARVVGAMDAGEFTSQLRNALAAPAAGLGKRP